MLALLATLAIMANPFNEATLDQFRRQESGPVEAPPILSGSQFDWQTKTLDQVPIPAKEFFRIRVNPDFVAREIFQWASFSQSGGASDYWVDARLRFYLAGNLVGELPVGDANNTGSSRLPVGAINFFPSDRPESGGNRFIELLRPNGFTGGWAGTRQLLTGQRVRVRCDEIAFYIGTISEAVFESVDGMEYFLGVFSIPAEP